MYDLGPAVTGSLCKSVANGKPESPISLPTWSSRIRVARRASSLRRALVCFCVHLSVRSSMIAAPLGRTLHRDPCGQPAPERTALSRLFTTASLAKRSTAASH